jgi:pimeloyl-ACP methyl ester carboxylesterase
MSFARPMFAAVIVAVAATSAAIRDGDTAGALSQIPTGGERPLPPPVEVRPEPEVALEDPAFEPLPGARADFGRLGGAVYQIEVPDNWNGKLVLDMHGWGELAPEAGVGPPDFRRYLITHGIAWGASSFSSTSLIPGRAADETAAVWDYFARTYGRPTRSYITGWSMGGAATHIAAERYADRFDGALAFCGAAGQTQALRIGTDFFVAAAYAAGVTQAEYDATTDVRALIHDRIRPALADPGVHKRFEDIMVDLTGGPRRFARAGFRDEERTNWRRAELLIITRLASNRDVTYRLGPESPVTSDEFNRAVIRLRTNDEFRRGFLEGNETTGNLRMPLLTLHTTGDGQVPIEQARIYGRKVKAAGKDDLIVERVVGDVGHCGFRNTEQEAALEALMAWVERGVKPQGTNVLVDDLRRLDRTFESAPRPGTPEADAVRGAGKRVTIRGTLSVEGAPLDARFLGAVVEGRNGLTAPCLYKASDARQGRFEITVMADAEASGCGARGARIVLWTYVDDTKLFSSEALPWPAEKRTVDFDAGFSTVAPGGATRPTVEFAGEVYDGDGRHVRAGSRVEAFVGGTRCGVGSVRRTGSFSGYLLAVAGPESIAECARGATVTFRVNGRPAVETAVNESGQRGLFDLTLR